MVLWPLAGPGYWLFNIIYFAATFDITILFTNGGKNRSTFFFFFNIGFFDSSLMLLLDRAASNEWVPLA